MGDADFADFRGSVQSGLNPLNPCYLRSIFSSEIRQT